MQPAVWRNDVVHNNNTNTPVEAACESAFSVMKATTRGTTRQTPPDQSDLRSAVISQLLWT